MYDKRRIDPVTKAPLTRALGIPLRKPRKAKPEIATKDELGLPVYRGLDLDPPKRRKAKRTAAAISAAYHGPKSECQCGHAGDGQGRSEAGDISVHAGILGHGACVVKGCACFKFTWAKHLPAYAAAIGEP